jgi:hypothetical protein
MNKLNKAENILVALAATAVILKLLKLSFSGMLLVVSMSALATIFLLYAVISLRELKVSKSVALLNFSFNMLTAFVICASLYLMMFWPGGRVLVLQCMMIFLVLVAFGLIYSWFRFPGNRTVLWGSVRKGFRKLAVALIMGLILSALPNDFRIKLFAIDEEKARAAIEEFQE